MSKTTSRSRSPSVRRHAATRGASSTAVEGGAASGRVVTKRAVRASRRRITRRSAFATMRLTDYAAGELPDARAAAIEEHLFTCAECGARAAELDGVPRAIRRAVGSAEVGGFVTDAVLNRLAREGVRVRTYALSPGAVVPCAVWEGDELMALRLRADFGGARELTLSERVAGTEGVRATGPVVHGSPGEVIHLVRAAWLRQVPAAEVEVLLTAHEDGGERRIASYTLVHGGTLHR